MPALIKRSNGIYYIVSTDENGRRKWISTRQRHKSLALQTLVNTPTRKEPVHQKTKLQEFLDEFMEHKRNIYSCETIQVYQRAFRAFIRHIGDVRMVNVSQRDTDLFKSKRLGEVSGVTVNLELRTLRAAFYTAVRWKVISDNPFRQVKLCEINDQSPAYFSTENFRLLLSVVDEPWLRDLVTVGAYTGMRRGELVHLRWEDVDMHIRGIHVRSHGKFRTKFGKSRIVPMNQQVLQVMERRRDHSHGDYVFESNCRPVNARHLSRVFKRCVRKAQLDERLHFHSVRHSFASWLVQNNASLYQVQKLLGHSSITVTEMYSHLLPADLHEAVDKLRLNGCDTIKPTFGV